MSGPKTRAKRLLIEIEAIQTGEFEDRRGDLLALVNEALRDAYLLAQEIIDADDQDKAA